MTSPESTRSTSHPALPICTPNLEAAWPASRFTRRADSLRWYSRSESRSLIDLSAGGDLGQQIRFLDRLDEGVFRALPHVPYPVRFLAFRRHYDAGDGI